MQAEGLSVELPRRCSDCRGCQKCSFRGQQHTEQETMEYKAIEQGIRLNKEKGYFEVQYAWQDDPAKLSNNLGQAIKIAENEEKKLIKEGLTEEFNEKFDEFKRLGTLGGAQPLHVHPARVEARQQDNQIETGYKLEPEVS